MNSLLRGSPASNHTLIEVLVFLRCRLFWLMIVIFCPIRAELSAMRAGHSDNTYEVALSFRKIKKVKDPFITLLLALNAETLSAI